MSKIQKIITPAKVPFVVRVNDLGGMQYDFVLIPPPRMTRKRAIREIDTAIRSVQDRYPNTYVFKDLMAILRPKGFTYPEIVLTAESW
jgi:hypothetical protein